MDKTGSTPTGGLTLPYDLELTPKEFDDRPYTYVATRPECDCVVAVQPLWPQKPAGA